MSASQDTMPWTTWKKSRSKVMSHPFKLSGTLIVTGPKWSKCQLNSFHFSHCFSAMTKVNIMPGGTTIWCFGPNPLLQQGDRLDFLAFRLVRSVGAPGMLRWGDPCMHCKAPRKRGFEAFADTTGAFEVLHFGDCANLSQDDLNLDSLIFLLFPLHAVLSNRPGFSYKFSVYFSKGYDH